MAVTNSRVSTCTWWPLWTASAATPLLSWSNSILSQLSAFPGVSGVSGVHLAAIETLLTRHIGPIARVVIKRHAASSSSARTLCENLAQHIESEEQQKNFIAQASRLLEE